MAEAIDRGLAGLAERGIGVETCLVGLDGSDDVPAVVAAALRRRPRGARRRVRRRAGRRHHRGVLPLLQLVTLPLGALAGWVAGARVMRRQARTGVAPGPLT